MREGFSEDVILQLRPKGWANFSQVQRKEKEPSTWIRCAKALRQEKLGVSNVLIGSQHGTPRTRGEAGGGGASGPQLRSCSLSQRKALSKRITDEISFLLYLGFRKEWTGETQHITSNYLLITLLQVCKCLEVEQGIMAANTTGSPHLLHLRDDDLRGKHRLDFVHLVKDF